MISEYQQSFVAVTDSFLCFLWNSQSPYMIVRDKNRTTSNSWLRHIHLTVTLNLIACHIIALLQYMQDNDVCTTRWDIRTIACSWPPTSTSGSPDARAAYDTEADPVICDHYYAFLHLKPSDLLRWIYWNPSQKQIGSTNIYGSRRICIPNQQVPFPRRKHHLRTWRICFSIIGLSHLVHSFSCSRIADRNL